MRGESVCPYCYSDTGLDADGKRKRHRVFECRDALLRRVEALQAVVDAAAGELSARNRLARALIAVGFTEEVVHDPDGKVEQFRRTFVTGRRIE